MAITWVWDNEEKTIIRYIFQGAWGWEDFYQILAEVHTTMDNVEHPVNLIIDVRKSGILPTNALSNISRLRNAPASPNTGRAVLIGGNMFIQRLYVMLHKLYPEMVKQFSLAQTLEEAQAILSQPLENSAPEKAT